MKSCILSSLQSCLAHDRHSNERLIIVISEGNSSVYLTKVHDEKTELASSSHFHVQEGVFAFTFKNRNIYRKFNMKKHFSPFKRKARRRRKDSSFGEWLKLFSSGIILKIIDFTYLRNFFSCPFITIAISTLPSLSNNRNSWITYFD